MGGACGALLGTWGRFHGGAGSVWRPRACRQLITLLVDVSQVIKKQCTLLQDTPFLLLHFLPFPPCFLFSQLWCFSLDTSLESAIMALGKCLLVGWLGGSFPPGAPQLPTTCHCVSGYYILYNPQLTRRSSTRRRRHCRCHRRCRLYRRQIPRFQGSRRNPWPKGCGARHREEL